MITKITGKLVRLSDTEATLEIGAFEYQVYVPEFVRRQLQSLIGEQVSLQTIEYLEGNPQQGRLTPRMVGFMNNAEREFFDLICSVDGVGVKKALRAMVRSVREVAVAIEEQDVLKVLKALRGSQQVTDQNPEDKYQALERYGHDLVLERPRRHRRFGRRHGER